MRGFVAVLAAAVFTITLGASAAAQSPGPGAASSADQDLIEAVQVLMELPHYGRDHHHQESWLSNALGRLFHASDDASCSDSARIELGSLLAMVGELGVAPEQITVYEFRAEDDEGRELIGVDGISVPGVGEEVVIDGLIAWATGNWPMAYHDPPRFDQARVGGKDVMVGSSDEADAVEYIYSSGGSALRIRAASEEDFIEFLEALP